MLPKLDELNARLIKTYDDLDRVKAEYNKVWDLKLNLEKTLSTITPVQMINDDTSIVHFRTWHSHLHQLNELSICQDLLKEQAKELMREMSKIRINVTVGIPKDVKERSKDYDGDDN